MNDTSNAPDPPSSAELVQAAAQLEASGLEATRDTSRQVLTVGAAILAIAAGAAKSLSTTTTALERAVLGAAAVALGASVAAGAATLLSLTWETTRQTPTARSDRSGARATTVRAALAIQLGAFTLAVTLATVAVIIALGHPTKS